MSGSKLPPDDTVSNFSENSIHVWIKTYMSRFANNALLGGGVRVRVWIREQRKIKRRSKALLSLCWQSWTSLERSKLPPYDAVSSNTLKT